MPSTAASGLKFEEKDAFLNSHINSDTMRADRSRSKSLRPGSRERQLRSPSGRTNTRDNDEHRLHGSPSPVHVVQNDGHFRTPSKASTSGLKRILQGSWDRNKALAYVAAAQLFGAFMALFTRLLETSESHVGPLQIIFIRMVITTGLTCVWLIYKRNPEFPLGPPNVRSLLVLRGFVGFFGIMGLYYSLVYLSLGEAIVITFLIPTAASILSAALFGEPFPLAERISGLVSLVGVILIANPFGSAHGQAAVTASVDGVVVPSNSTSAATATDAMEIPTATTGQRLGAVVVALIGVVGGASAYTMVRYIGKRAHPLIIVNYYSVWCIIVSGVAITFIPALGGFQGPQSLKEWALFAWIGITGFTMQLLLTAGLAAEKSSRATNMLYTQMLFALALDKIVWGTTPGVWSIVGSCLILGSAIFVASRKSVVKQDKPEDAERGRAEEEVGLVDAEALLSSDDEDDEGIEMREESRGRSLHKVERQDGAMD